MSDLHVVSIVGRFADVHFRAYADNLFEYSRKIELVGKAASFGNLVDFKTVDISRKQKFLRRIDTRGVEELQRRNTFFFYELTSYVVFGQIEFVVYRIDIEVGVGEVLDNSVGNNLDMVALLHRAVKLRYKAENKVGERHYYVG